MSLRMKPACEICGVRLFPDGEAFICRHELTFCYACTNEMSAVCPACGDHLVERPRRERKG